MAFERLLGLLKAGTQVAFGGETPVQEAKRVSENLLGIMAQRDKMAGIQIAEEWMGGTRFSKHGKTGIEQISLLVFSNNRDYMEVAARVLKNHHIYLAACVADREQRPTQWITRMVQAESAFVRDAAFDLIGDFDLDDIDTIREAMGIESKQPAFVDSREPD